MRSATESAGPLFHKWTGNTRRITHSCWADCPISRCLWRALSAWFSLVRLDDGSKLVDLIPTCSSDGQLVIIHYICRINPNEFKTVGNDVTGDCCWFVLSFPLLSGRLWWTGWVSLGWIQVGRWPRGWRGSWSVSTNWSDGLMLIDQAHKLRLDSIGKDPVYTL